MCVLETWLPYPGVLQDLKQLFPVLYVPALCCKYFQSNFKQILIPANTFRLMTIVIVIVIKIIFSLYSPHRINFVHYFRVFKPSVALPVWLLTWRSRHATGRMPSRTVISSQRRGRSSRSWSPMNQSAMKTFWPVETETAKSAAFSATELKTAWTAPMRTLVVSSLFSFLLKK